MIDTDRYPGSRRWLGFTSGFVSGCPITFTMPNRSRHGGIFRKKVPALKSWLIDQDDDVIAWWHRRLMHEPLEPHHRRRLTKKRPTHVEIIQGCGIAWMEAARRWAMPELLVYLDPPICRRHASAEAVHARDDRCRSQATFESSPDVALHGGDQRLSLGAVRAVPGRVAHGHAGSDHAWRDDADRMPVDERGGSISVVDHDDYSELGSDFRERERVAKKVRRWEANFARMTDAERRATLLRLIQLESGRLGFQRKGAEAQRTQR